MEVIIGVIVGVFGVHGEVKIKSNTDFAKKRYQRGNKIILFSPIKKTKVEVEVNTHKTSNNGLDILSFSQITTVEEAQEYIGYQLLIEKPQDDLKEDMFYYADLWNCEVWCNDQLIGSVNDLFDSGAHIILRIKRNNKKDLLYPFVSRFIEKVDIENKRIILKPIEGMIEE